MNVPLFKIHYNKEDINAVNEVIRRGSYYANGPEIKEFEEALAEYVNVNYATVFNSGTSALYAILRAYDIGPGDEVIVPSFTFISTVNVIRMVGATPVFVDIEDATCGLSLKEIDHKVTEKTKAVLLVHYGGCPAYFTEIIEEYCKNKDLLFFEDAASCLGGKIHDFKVGSFGQAAMFSFCQNKIITTGGEGGAVVTYDPVIKRRLDLFRSHGQEGNQYITEGENLRMPTMNAAMGLSQLQRIDDIIQMRTNVANLYKEHLEDYKTLDVPSDSKSTWWIFPVFDVKKEKLQKKLNEKNIAAKMYYPPIHETCVYRKYACILPETERIWNTSLCLPMYPELTEKEIKYVCKIVKEAIL